jgi:hypothetical protein
VGYFYRFLDPEGYARQRKVPLVGGVVLIFIGYLLMYPSTRPWLTSLGSASWPQVEGRVTSSELVSAERPDRWGHYAVYKAAVRYAYEVGGESYHGDRVTFTHAEFRRDRQRMKQIAAAYPAGSAVTVYHHPRRPGVATLQPGAEPGLRNAVLVGLALMALGFVWCGYDCWRVGQDPLGQS